MDQIVGVVFPQEILDPIWWPESRIKIAVQVDRTHFVMDFEYSDIFRVILVEQSLCERAWMWTFQPFQEVFRDCHL